MIDERSRRGRGQLVLVAAGIIAVAMVPILVSYLQLGYAADVHASDDYTQPAANAERVLERAVHNASTAIRGEYAWGERSAAVSEVRSRLAPRLSILEAARVSQGTGYLVSYNQSAAAVWAAGQCPGGNGRSFGPCQVRDGVIVQERVGSTHLVAVAFDVTIVLEHGQIDETVVVRAIGGVDH